MLKGHEEQVVVQMRRLRDQITILDNYRGLLILKRQDSRLNYLHNLQNVEADEPVFVGESDVKESHFGGEKLKATADY